MNQLVIMLISFSFLVFSSCNANEKFESNQTDEIEVIYDNSFVSADDNTSTTNKKNNKKTDEQTTNEQTTPVILPDWALDIGISLPSDMEYIKESSHTSSADSPKESFNSINLIFIADIEIALQQAKIIAEKANIPLDYGFIQAMKMNKKQIEEAKKHGDDIGLIEFKGAIYSNMPAEENPDNIPDYMITIIVEENGLLSINAINQKQMKEEAEKHVDPEFIKRRDERKINK